MIKAADLTSYGPLTVNFARRELASRYKRSLLGWLWSVINPLSIVLTYSLVFGVIFRTPPPETANGRAEYFSLYLFNGLVTWGVFANILTGAMGWMASVSDMRKKVYFPAETAIFGGAIAVAVQTGIEMLVLGAIMALFLNISWTFLLYPLVLVLATLFGLGLGLIASILNTLYRDISYLIGIGLNLAFFLVPIVWTPELLGLLPDGKAYGLPVGRLVELHPMHPFVTAGHDLVYFQRLPGIGQVLAMLAWSVGTFALGLWYFRRRSMQISEEL